MFHFYAPHCVVMVTKLLHCSNEQKNRCRHYFIFTRKRAHDLRSLSPLSYCDVDCSSVRCVSLSCIPLKPLQIATKPLQIAGGKAVNQKDRIGMLIIFCYNCIYPNGG